MGGLGPEVRRLREAKGVTLDQVAAATKVGVRHLEALERGDFGALPSDVFVRGFIRAYADFLGAASEPLLTLYRRDREGLDSVASESGERTVQEMSRILAASSSGTGRGGFALRFSLDAHLWKLALRAGGLAAGVVCIAALAIVLIRRNGDSVQPQTATPLRASRQESVPAQRPPAPPPAIPSAPLSAPVSTLASAPPPADPAPVAAPTIAPRQVHALEPGLEVPEHGVGTDVANGRLEGRATRFEEGSAVWFWTRIDGAQSGQVIRHVWIHDDREVHSIDLKVGSARWRTWSRKTLLPGSVGRWSVEARDAYGRALASEEFECRPKP